MSVWIAAVAAAAGAAAGGYSHWCTHYWQRDLARTRKLGFQEKDARIPGGGRIHYAEGPDSGPALLLIHGQTGCWEDYCTVLPRLSCRWHVFAVDCYGHGKSSHDPARYSMAANGDDLIWFVRHVISAPTVVSGHSSGGLLAAYVAARCGAPVVGALLEDPPVFSTEPDSFPRSFAFLDTYQPLHQYRLERPDVPWEVYYLRHCLWGKLFLPAGVPEKLAAYARRFLERHPEGPLQFFFLPPGLNQMFLYLRQYDLAFGETFYDYSWHSGISHHQLMGEIAVPTVFLHCKDDHTEDGILLAASSDEQARRAVEEIGDCRLMEVVSTHDIHRAHPDWFLDAAAQLLPFAAR